MRLFSVEAKGFHLGRQGGLDDEEWMQFTSEKQRLPVFGKRGDDCLDVGDERFVQQSVGLVENEEPEVLEVYGVAAAAHEVDEPARGRNDDVRPLAESQRLGHAVHAADDDGLSEPDVRAQRLELLGYLEGKLAGGRQDQRKDAERVGRQLLDDGQRKRGGLPWRQNGCVRVDLSLFALCR